jgi:hypothetical protein
MFSCHIKNRTIADYAQCVLVVVKALATSLIQPSAHLDNKALYQRHNASTNTFKVWLGCFVEWAENSKRPIVLPIPVKYLRGQRATVYNYSQLIVVWQTATISWNLLHPQKTTFARVASQARSIQYIFFHFDDNIMIVKILRSWFICPICSRSVNINARNFLIDEMAKLRGEWEGGRSRFHKWPRDKVGRK